MDEAVFSSKQINRKIWYIPSKDPVLIKKRKIGFKAIAVASAMDINGRVVYSHIVDGAIEGTEFMKFLEGFAA